MLVPMSWLREFVPYEGTPEALGDKLTMLGLELEGINHPFADLAQIKVGYVALCQPHPDSSHLHCCKVDLGEGELVDIVCGAPNVAAGQKVAVAPVGSRLPDGTRIKKAKLRGQPSNGMICSERELGLSDDHSGIMVLPESCDIGHNLLDALYLERDVLDLSITPNRGDCLSIYGIARETAMAFDLPLHMPEIPLILDDKGPDEQVEATIVDPSLCFLYAGRVVTSAKIAQSPMRLRYRLLSIGARPINTVVDITNYILFECGQPLHAFDLDRLAQGKIVVRRAKSHEKIVTLDGKQRNLTPEDLCICDADKPVALAGIMGGENSEITDQTTNIFVESAVFSPATIRKTAKRLGLHSEASYRFERGIDQNASIMALDRACAMMASVAGGLVRKGFTCAEPRPFIPEKIAYSPLKTSALLGCDISPDFQKKALEKDGCPVHEMSGNWEVTQPSWRHDLTRAADLAEEVARIYGVDEIPCVLPPVLRTAGDDPQNISQFAFLRRIRHWAAGLGLHEAVNYSFTGQKQLDLLQEYDKDTISLLYPLSEDLNVLRPVLAPGLLADLTNNLAYGGQSVRIFEIANVFRASAESETGAAEKPYLGIILYGPRHDDGFGDTGGMFGYRDIKGLVENLFRFLHLSPPSCVESTETNVWDPHVEIMHGKTRTGFIGQLKPSLAKNWNAQKPVWICELDLHVLRKFWQAAETHFKALPVFPAVKRDITVMARGDMPVSEILDKILAVRMPLLEGAELVDCFLPENKFERNLTFRLTFRHSGRTLKDGEVDKEREKMAEYLRKELNVRI